MRQLILASQSPRRRELLQRAGYKFLVNSLEISEIPNKNLSLEKQIEDLARRKAEALVESGKVLKGQGNLLLSADTVVVLDGELLNKPENLAESERHLRRLSSRTHQVITAIYLWDLDTGRAIEAHDTAHVTFRTLSESEIQQYVASRDGMDKAGAYGIQGMGGTFVAKLEGSLDTVMGLPVHLVTQILQENGWNVDR